MNRRGLFAGLGAFLFGSWFGKVNAQENKREFQGFIVHYIDVGSMPPFKAQAFLDKVTIHNSF